MATPSLPRLGFIGLGLMGKPMARHLLAAGYPLTVFNRSKGALDELASAGAVVANSPRQVAERADLIMTCLPDSPDVQSIVVGETASPAAASQRGRPTLSGDPSTASVLSGAKPDSVVIDFSTISPTVSKRIAAQLAKRSVHWLDAPVTGGTVGAQNAALTIMVGGEKEIFDRCLPILRTVGKTVLRVGPAGSGHTLKLVNQIIIAIYWEALGEGLQVAQRAGLDFKTTLDVLSSGAAGGWFLTTWKDKILENNFAPGFKSVHQDKDLRLALELAKELGIELPATKIVKKRFEALLARGDGELGTHALVKLFLAQR